MRSLSFFLIFALLCALCACQDQVTEQDIPQQEIEQPVARQETEQALPQQETEMQAGETRVESEQTEPPQTAKDPANSDIQFTEITTETNYLMNDALRRGNADEIIESQGAICDAYPAYDNTRALLAGADAERNLYTVDWDGYSMHRLSAGGEDTVILSRLLGDRENDIYVYAFSGTGFAWSECPNAAIMPDPERGADWLVCYADINTGEIKIVDRDKGFRPAEPVAYPYLCPSGLALTDEYLSYISFEENDQKEVVQALKLYHIPTGEMEIITYLEEDPTCNALGYPSIDGDTLVWCNGYIRPDGLYEGYISSMSLSDRTVTRLNTTENVLNPHAAGQYIVAESKPNLTFYDSEIVVYDAKTRQWIYKINQNATEYREHINSALDQITCSGHYAAWHASVNYLLLVMDLRTGTLYQIAEAPSDGLLWGIDLLPGNLLLWDKENYDPETAVSKHTLQYAFLK